MKAVALSLVRGLSAAAHESDRWELTLESGYAWQVGNWTEISRPGSIRVTLRGMTQFSERVGKIGSVSFHAGGT